MVNINNGKRKLSRSRLLTIIYTLILFFLNFIRIYDNNFWGDEGFSIMLSKMTVQEMLKATAEDVHPPLYYFFVIATYRVFGAHGWAYHLVSMVPYAIGLVFILTVIWRRFGKETAILMVTFTSIMSEAVTYNVEVRMYSWAALFVLLSYYAFYSIILDGKIRSYILFVLASLGAAYTHYYAMISVAFFYLALPVMAMKKIKFRSVIVVYLLTIIGYLPWLVPAVSTFIRKTQGWWLTSSPTFLGGMHYFFSAGKEKWWYSLLMLVLTAASIAILVVRDIKTIEMFKKDEKSIVRILKGSQRLSDTCFWLLWGIIASIGTLVSGLLLSVLIRPLFINRFLYPATIVLWLVVSVGITRFDFKRVTVSIVLIVTLIVCIPNYINTYKTEKMSDAECEATARYMEQTIGETGVILTNIHYLDWTLLAYYMPNTSYKYNSTIYTDFEFDSETVYWLVWAEDISEEEVEWLSEYGYSVTEVYHDGILGSNPVHLYQMDRIKRARSVCTLRLTQPVH